ncbi:flagellar filament capping protein FliD [Thalassoroseus pseudoceratinae]|uniref:flagellar filament capping protein FliD n=1 Tax=Thalassoroseus pseudoceratinae TaxID=2713176 RepID=UPI0014234F71|nr:flagellar filament capping protein FliD [Thalassoroseus pseudoceratinae]
MSTISAGIGLISGIDTSAIIEALVAAQSGSVNLIEARVAGYQETASALNALEASVLSLSLSGTRLKSESTFNSLTTNNSDTSQLTVKTDRDTVSPGSYGFRTVRTASAHQMLSGGFSSADQKVDAGTLVIGTGGSLTPPATLDLLNDGEGITPGIIKLTDRSGSSAEIDLSTATNVDDVLSAINSESSIGITASVEDGRFVLTDTSGGGGTLEVSNVGLTQTAQELGLDVSASGDTLTGSEVFTVFEGMTLDYINDGNGLRLSDGGDDLRITLTDDTTLDINLDDATTIGDVISSINDHEENEGRVSATLVDGRIQLEDLTAGGGSSSLEVENLSSSKVVRQLGLDVTASGSTLTGNRLTAGPGSVLLRNLNGGNGVTAGTIQLTDRTGTTADIDLSSAESLDEVIAAINGAKSTGDVDLQIVAEIDATGTGITITDTSGAATSNLIISDLTGSLASDLNIAADTDQTTIESDALNLRSVNEATSLSTYAPDGKSVGLGSILITDSTGKEAIVSINSTVKTIGDVIDRINSASGVSVTARLNDTGDGFVIEDDAGGEGTLTIEQSGDGTTVEDLRLTGEASDDGSGNQTITSREAVVIELTGEETVSELVEQLNTFSGTVSASLINDGSPFNPVRLEIRSASTGSGSQLLVDTSGIDLGFQTTAVGRDALLAVTSGAGQEFLVTSETNTFDDVVTGLDVTAVAASETSATITIARDTARSSEAIQNFVDTYNNLVTILGELTKFEPSTNSRGVLQGNSFALRLEQRLTGLLNDRFNTDGGIRQLNDIGVRVSTGGKLSFDTDEFQAAVTDDPEGVADFFLRDETGFGAQAEAAIQSLTDPIDGAFKTATDAVQANIDAANERIADLNEILDVRRNRLLIQFTNMESIIGTLNNQQQALAAFQPVPNQQSSS